MAISGSGTQDNPYIFDTVEDFVEVISREGCYAEANEPDKIFDCNDGVLTAPIFISCAYLDCKGLTILNALINQTNSPIMKLRDATSNQFARNIRNLNVYNFCNICYDSLHGKHSLLINPDYEQWQGNDVPPATFTNCNFAGVLIGYGNGSNYPVIGHYMTNNSDYKNVQLIFNDCTFNFHFTEPSGYTNYPEITLFAGNRAAPVKLTNCSVSVSGNTPYTIIMMCGNDTQNYPYAKFDTVTITNSQTNPLICLQAKFGTPQSGYNYYKAWITALRTGTTGITINDPLALINISRLTVDATSTMSLTGKVMQETNPSDPDYIYNQANLAAKDFLVGRVIT